MLLVETRVLGRRSRPLDRWSIPVPPEFGGGGEDGAPTLRELITRIVHAEVEAFEARQRARRLVPFLPFADDDPRTAEVLSKVLLLARDTEIRDPNILERIRAASVSG